MKGKFIGKDSMGFKNGVKYNIRSDLKIVRKGETVFGENIPSICIYDKNSKAWCPYQSLEAVMKNWEFSC